MAPFAQYIQYMYHIYATYEINIIYIYYIYADSAAAFVLYTLIVLRQYTVRIAEIFQFSLIVLYFHKGWMEQAVRVDSNLDL